MIREANEADPEGYFEIDRQWREKSAKYGPGL